MSLIDRLLEKSRSSLQGQGAEIPETRHLQGASVEGNHGEQNYGNS